MSVDLNDSIPSLLWEVNPPGQTLITMSGDEALGRLIDAWWQCRLYGLDFLANWDISAGGVITPNAGFATSTGIPTPPVGWYTDDGTNDIGQEIIRAVVMIAGHRCVLSQYMSLKTSTTYRAGPVEASSAQSSSLLGEVLKTLSAQVSIILERLSDVGYTTVYALDQVINATELIGRGDSWFVR